MGPIEMDQIFRKFDQIADKVSLNEMLSIISDGKVPSTETTDGFNHVLASLQDKYDNICNSASAILELDEMPG